MTLTTHFNPRAPCGARLRAATAFRSQGDFNPRAPCGARRSHGCYPAYPYRHFNPRAPCGARLWPFLPTGHHNVFQSTRPLRGATPRVERSAPSLPFQSTRPLRGATGAGRLSAISKAFQSTRPLRGATTCSGSEAAGYSTFQSTRPLRGATEQRAVKLAALSISIHAPLAGRDKSVRLIRYMWNDFNPRAPCGARPRGA